MPTTHESVCCTEIGQFCITEHPGFQSICLDFWVLKTAKYAYRQQQSTDNHTGND
ncbi:unnamed protein product [Pocillopora meandrina]|uniref:Uncharacterized protein n=1 Tax=Pocillopora meandrina TaxID=46732 RepID=A0AAU9X9Q2_9CNID|nr:unnamed protein product [Pocillopora meandrina]CAH3166834.1 unnamed protein product [Pocillopora meandrina]